MAYLRSLGLRCRDCTSPATEELLSNTNDRRGVFCKRHAPGALRVLQREEHDRGEWSGLDRPKGRVSRETSR